MGWSHGRRGLVLAVMGPMWGPRGGTAEPILIRGVRVVSMSEAGAYGPRDVRIAGERIVDIAPGGTLRPLEGGGSGPRP